MLFEQADPEDLSFPRAHCQHCACDVLVYRDLNDKGELTPRCLDCGGELLDEAEQGWSTDTLMAQGYRLEGQDTHQQKGSCGNCGKD